VTDSALVTGASRGIGLGIATRLAQLGYALTVTARDANRLGEIAGHLRREGAADVHVVGRISPTPPRRRRWSADTRPSSGRCGH